VILPALNPFLGQSQHRDCHFTLNCARGNIEGFPQQRGLVLAVIETNRQRSLLVGSLINGLTQNDSVAVGQARNVQREEGVLTMLVLSLLP
jgi:hypothetical protein